MTETEPSAATPGQAVARQTPGEAAYEEAYQAQVDGLIGLPAVPYERLDGIERSTWEDIAQRGHAAAKEWDADVADAAPAAPQPDPELAVDRRPASMLQLVDFSDEPEPDEVRDLGRALGASGWARVPDAELDDIVTGITPGQADPWQVIADLAGILYRGGQDAGDVRRAALGVLWDNGITLEGAAPAQEPQPAPGNAEVAYEQWIERRDPASVGTMAGFTAGWQEALIAVGGWPRCPNGCGCRLGTEDADARDCACDGLCCYDEIEVSEVFAERDALRRGCGMHPGVIGYEHPDCGFHWHGKDGADVPLDANREPACPRCEVLKLRERMRMLLADTPFEFRPDWAAEYLGDGE